MKEAIIAVDAALLREFAGVDEDESEAVALALVELLFAETNAVYAQHCLARRAVQRLAEQLAGSVVDAIFAAVVVSEQPIAASTFRGEDAPAPSTQDRHAVRMLPCRSPGGGGDAMSSSSEKLHGGGASSPSRDSRASSSPEKLQMAGAGGNSPIARAPRRKAADKATLLDRSASHVAIPEIQELPEEEDEKPDTKAWRATCLRELTVSQKKPSFSKWATVARAFASTTSGDQKVSMEVEIVESAPSLLQKELLGRTGGGLASGSASSIKMKSNVDSFSNVVDVIRSAADDEQQHTSRSQWSQFTRDNSLRDGILPAKNARRPRKSEQSLASIKKEQGAGSTLTTTKKKKSNGAMHLNDKLSRKRSNMGGSGSGNGGQLWRYERDGVRGSGSSSTQPFTPEISDFNAAALPSTIQLSSGVVLSQGESLVEGPARIESPTTMSRKRFDLHQSLATDLMLHWSERDLMLSSPSSASSSSLYHHNQHHSHHQTHPHDPYFKPYEEVPAEPIPAPPHLSPIPNAIPRTHLAQSLSTPALRVRSPTNSKNGPSHSALHSASLSTSASHAELPMAGSKHRPRTALQQQMMGKLLLDGNAMKQHNVRVGSAGAATSTATGSSSRAPAAAKYLREFPKPQPGVVKLSQVDDSQRLAWIS